MKILAFTTTFWDDNKEMAEAKRPELEAWFGRVKNKFKVTFAFLATGCQDNPSLNPLRSEIKIVSSGEPKTKEYDVHRWSYFLCAFEAALWEARRKASHWDKLNNWDLLVELESNCWINPSLDVDRLLNDFLARPELIMAPSWLGQPDFNFLVMKPAAVPAFLHHRLRGNLVDDDQPLPMLAEEEMGRIFKGRWWNPWPEFDNIRQEYGARGCVPVMPDGIAETLPIVALPSPEIQRLFSL